MLYDSFTGESAALQLRWLAGFGEEYWVSPIRIAKRILGPESVRLVPSRIRASLSLCDGEWEIHVSDTLPRSEWPAAVAHELGEWILRDKDGSKYKELACQDIARALMGHHTDVCYRVMNETIYLAESCEMPNYSESEAKIRSHISVVPPSNMNFERKLA